MSTPPLKALRRIGPAGGLFDPGQDKGVSFAPGDVVQLSESCALDVLRDSPADWAPAEPTPAAESTAASAAPEKE